MLESILYPYHVELLRMYDDLMRDYIASKDWTKARDCCAKTIPLYEKVYPPYWPLLGLQYYMLGKLEWYLENPPVALEFFLKAVSVLSATHNDDPLLDELKDLCTQAYSSTQH